MFSSKWLLLSCSLSLVPSLSFSLPLPLFLLLPSTTTTTTKKIQADRSWKIIHVQKYEQKSSNKSDLSPLCKVNVPLVSNLLVLPLSLLICIAGCLLRVALCSRRELHYFRGKDQTHCRILVSFPHHLLWGKQRFALLCEGKETYMSCLHHETTTTNKQTNKQTTAMTKMKTCVTIRSWNN